MSEPIDIVLPCFNANKSWHHELLRFHEFIRDHFTIRYILVNDGSVHGNLQDQVKFLHERNVPLTSLGYEVNKGKGFALRHGVKHATAKYTLYTDIDFPFTNDSMKAVLTALCSDRYDIVAGYRDEKYYQNTISPFRKGLSKTFRFFIRHLLRMPITDTQCGIKGFNVKGKKKFLATTINRYLFDFEFIYTSVRDPFLKVAPVEVVLKDDVVLSRMKATILLQETGNLLKVLLFSRRKRENY
jgi:glycosyltransferase involved in cell wall biosynthesis